MKAVAAHRYIFNTDEPQHLHVVWGWVHGQVQYRDLFDNHPPLFHLLMAPLFALFPELADIVIPMRLQMIPFYLASLIAVYRIGRALYSEAIGIWAALAAGALPWFFFPGTEFRPDDLYAALWLWTLVVAVEGEFTKTRAVVIGLILGACAGITMKTSLLVTALSLAAAITFAFRRLPLRKSVENLIVMGLAGLVVPALLCGYFAANHALRDLGYCVLKHNIVPHVERWGGSRLHYFYLPIALPFLLATAKLLYRGSASPRRVFITLLPLIYYILLFAYWPDITKQDQLPAMPLLPLAVIALVWIEKPRVWILAGGFALSLLLIWRTQVLQRGATTKYITPIATVLDLTKPDEPVMDLKGDAIYRPRPFYYVIETFTKARMKAGWIKNNIPQRLTATQTAVCFHPPFPGAETMKFVNANYLPLADHPNILVLGQALPSPANGAIHFNVTIPAEYLLLDHGHPSSKPEMLASGAHQFPVSGNGPFTLFWSRAWALGYRP